MTQPTPTPTVSRRRYVSPLDIPRLERRRPSKRIKQVIAALKTLTMCGIITDNNIKAK